MPPAARAGASRALAAASVAAGAAGAALLLVLLTGGGPSGPGPQSPPWPMPRLEAVAAGGMRWDSDSVLAGRPAALIYVDAECPHCKAELLRWDALVRDAARPPRVWVIASPSSEASGADWLPPSLRERAVKDVDASAARALGVAAVPVTFWVDGLGTTRIVHVGQTPLAALIGNLETTSNPE